MSTIKLSSAIKAFLLAYALHLSSSMPLYAMEDEELGVSTSTVVRTIEHTGKAIAHMGVMFSDPSPSNITTHAAPAVKEAGEAMKGSYDIYEEMGGCTLF